MPAHLSGEAVPSQSLSPGHHPGSPILDLLLAESSVFTSWLPNNISPRFCPFPPPPPVQLWVLSVAFPLWKMSFTPSFLPSHLPSPSPWIFSTSFPLPGSHMVSGGVTLCFGHPVCELLRKRVPERRGLEKDGLEVSLFCLLPGW